MADLINGLNIYLSQMLNCIIIIHWLWWFMEGQRNLEGIILLGFCLEKEVCLVLSLIEEKKVAFKLEEHKHTPLF